MGESGFAFGGGSFAGGSFVAGFSEGAGLEGVDGASFQQIVLESLPTPEQVEPGNLRSFYVTELARELLAPRNASDARTALLGNLALTYARTLGTTADSLLREAQALNAATATAVAASSASTSATGGISMGFLDDVGGFISDAVGGIGGFINTAAQAGLGALASGVSAAAANPAAVVQTVQLIQALRNQGSAQPTLAGMGNPIVVNSDTGSMMMNFDAQAALDSITGAVSAAGGAAGGLANSLVAALPQILGQVLRTGAGGAAAGAAGAIGADALLGLFNGGGLAELGPPPVNPMTGRRKSSITFIDPNTGRPVVYKSQGTCLLSTGDISGARRVQRVARRASRGRRRSPARAPVSVQLQPRNHVVCGSCLTSPCGCK